MSFYAVLEGQLKYPDEVSFNRVVGVLEAGGWVDKEGFFVDECDTRIQDDPQFVPNIDREARTIDIPCAHYRNLSRVDFFLNEQSLEEINAGIPKWESVVKGYIVGTSTDGCFTGWFIEDGVETNYDLKKWALENLEDEDKVPPKREDYEDEDQYHTEFNEWTGVVEQEFIADHT